MKTTLLLALLFTANLAQAQSKPLDKDANKAVQDTKAMLNDPSQINAYAKENKEAAQANDNVKALMGGNAADTADVYKLSADIFENLATESGGDPAAMQKMLAEAMRNPAAFAQKLSPEQRARLTELAGKAEAHKPSAARP
jgi:hypothetical protein